MKKQDFIKTIVYDAEDKIWIATATHGAAFSKGSTVISAHSKTEAAALKRLDGILEAHLADLAGEAAAKSGNIHLRLGAPLHARLSSYIKKQGLKQNTFIARLIEDALPKTRTA